MTTVIKSGTNGNTAIVDNEGHLLTQSVSRLENIQASLDGDSYFIDSGIVNLTSDSTSHVLYVKNESSESWIVGRIMSRIGKSAGGDGNDFTGSLTVAATDGTLITAGTAIRAGNLNLGDQTPLDGVFLAGVEGSTITGGLTRTNIIIGDQMTTEISSGPIVIQPGLSIAIGITPPTGNTSMNFSTSIIIYRADED